MEIIIPSYKRGKESKTPKLLSKAKIACHEFEEDEYKKYNKNELMIIPDELKGKGMGVIRNYILENSKGEKLVMLDDDISSIGHFENGVRINLKEDEIYNFIENSFRMTEELGTKLWGVNLLEDPRSYRTFAPFSLTNVILGPFMGIIKDKSIKFDERLGLKEDYDYSIQVLRKYRKILRFNKYHYSCGHITMKGGCATYRTSEAERKQAKLFQKKWGSKIVKIERKTTAGNVSINPLIKVPIKGV